MMTQCQKCGSIDIIAPLRPMTPAGGYASVTITEPKTSGFQIRSTESAELKAAVCGSCGYAEHYIDDFSRLWKYWQKGYR